MGWFAHSLPATDSKRGADALVYFHNQASKYPSNYSLTYDQLKQKLQDDSHGVFLDGFGFAINSVPMNEADVQTAMVNLADAGEGKFPSHWRDFFNALSQQATDFSFVDAISYTASSTASDIGSGLKQVGDTAISTLKNASGLITLLPLMAFAGLGLYIYTRAKSK